MRAPPTHDGVICGVDCGTLRHPNWVAWLSDGQFTLDVYVPTSKQPLPELSVFPGDVRCIAFDAPQGLPAQGEPVRRADVDANTPTRRLPGDRDELSKWKAYRGLIEVGISVFWWVYKSQLATIAGLPPVLERPTTIVEAYPRYVIRRLWPSLQIPSKRNAPLEYIDTVYSRIQKLGYVCRSVIRPSVDQVDAMLCALAASAYESSNGLPNGTVGDPPVPDEASQVMREGYIIGA
jgi:predicted nuclease with RNAse H fold